MPSSLSSKKNKLENDIIKTLLYYNLVGKPLTLLETWKCLINSNFIQNYGTKITLTKLEHSIKSLITQNRIKNFRGFYYLHKQNQSFVRQRIAKEKITQQKIKLLKNKIKFLRFLPYTRAIFVNGSLVFETARKNSDLDLIIIAQPGRIWTARAFITILSLLLKKYRTTKHQINRLCFNHYLTTKNLKISFQDLSSAQLHSKVYCLWSYNNKNQKFLNKFLKSNPWLEKYLRNFYQNKHIIDYKIKNSFIASTIQLLFESCLNNFIGNWLEQFSKNQQLKSINKDKDKRLPNARIITKNNELIFHPEPINEKFMRLYRKKLSTII